MKKIIALLIAMMMLLCILPAQASVGAISGTKKPASTPAPASGSSASFALKPIDWDTAVLGQYALPDGYSATRLIYNCDETTTLGHPVRCSVILSNNEKNARMQYYYAEDYLQRVYAASSLLPHVEGEIDPTTMTMMRTFVDADGYCDTLAKQWASNAVFYKSEDISAYDAALQLKESEFLNDLIPVWQSYGMYTDWYSTTAAQRVYTYDQDGTTYCICITASVYAIQYHSNFNIAQTNIVWEVPAYYILWCPLESYESIHDSDFKIFMENTSVNDEMIALNDQLNAQIQEEVCRKINMMCAASSAYMASMTALTFSMVESQMSYGSYSGNSNRFSNYLFDENEYTLSNGTTVNISTGYDYVWEGSNGTVYYSNSLFDAPGGATQLYPNH